MPTTAHEPPTAHLTRMRTALARALSVDDVNQLGRDTGQSERPADELHVVGSRR